jgi:aminoglycoside phosphotransferase (APT) family kinase protein
MVEDLPDPRARELMLAEALAHVPGYRPGDPTIETVRLPGGRVNRSYALFTPAGRYVMRLSQGADAWLASDRSVERELHGIAAAAGLAPGIVHADSRDRWLITEYVPGRLWTEADFADPEQLMRLAGALRKLHALPAPDRGRFDLLGALQGYGGRITAHAAPVVGAREISTNAGQARQVGNGGDAIPTITGYLRDAAEAWRISGAASRSPAILHHDLNGANIIENARRLALIDWECAAVADPLLDVACILSYYPSAWPHETLLLQYSGLENITHRQVAASVWLFDLHTFFWYRERRLRLLPTDAELEAEYRLSARLPATIEDWQSVAS